ncbi:MAG: hypothetical protein ACO2ZP_01475 [Bacteriovoracaceae bacterium]
MKLQRFALKLGPTNFILIFLFPVLCIYEFFDGRIDVGDYGVALLFALFINDIYMGKLLNKNSPGRAQDSLFVKSYNKFKVLNLREIPILVRYPYNPIRASHENEKVQKSIMNIVFILLLIGPILMGAANFDLEVRSSLYKTLIITWSMLFLGLSYFKLRNENHKFRLLYFNLALVVLVGSVFLF